MGVHRSSTAVLDSSKIKNVVLLPRYRTLVENIWASWVSRFWIIRRLGQSRISSRRTWSYLVGQSLKVYVHLLAAGGVLLERLVSLYEWVRLQIHIDIFEIILDSRIELLILTKSFLGLEQRLFGQIIDWLLSIVVYAPYVERIILAQELAHGLLLEVGFNVVKRIVGHQFLVLLLVECKCLAIACRFDNFVKVDFPIISLFGRLHLNLSNLKL